MSSEAAVARRYARALYELIAEGGEQLQAPLLQLAEAAKVDEVAALLERTSVPASAKVKVLTAIVKELPAELGRLLDLLAARGKLSLLPEIGAQTTALLQADADAIDVELITAVKVPAAVRNKIAAALESLVGKKLKVTAHQNKAIIGGFIVNIGDRRIDHSIRTRLNGMRAALAG